ncbi:MFS transporter [Brevibacillus invocatus]
MSMLAQVSSENKFGRNSGIVNGGVAIIGIFLGPIIVTQIAAVTNWQMSFLLVSLPTFILAFALIKYTREVEISPADKALHEEGKAGGFFVALKYRNIVICCLIAIVNMAGYWTLLLFAPLYWVNVGNISVQNMGFMTSAMGLLGIVLSFICCLLVLQEDWGRFS